MANLLISCQFTKENGRPATSLALADIRIKLMSQKKSNGDVATIWTDTHPIAELAGLGMYNVPYASADLDVYAYFVLAEYTGAEILDTNFSFGNLGDSATSATAAQMWSYDTRTLTQSAAQIEAVLAGSTLTLRRGDTLTIHFTGLGSLVSRSKLWFTVKQLDSEADSKARIQITESGGLIYLNGEAAATAGQGSIVVTDEATGALTITLDEAASKLLRPFKELIYDIQMLRSGDVHTLTAGECTIVGDVTRAVT